MNHDSFSWLIAHGGSEEEPFFIRFAEIGQDFERHHYPHRLNVFWTLRTPTEHKLPSDLDAQETGIFEERIIEAIEIGGHSILPMILTGRGQKEYVFQTKDPQLFIDSLIQMPQEEERYPIEIIHNEDESWGYYDRVLSDIKK